MSADKRLVDLNPNWVCSGGEGVTRNGQPVPYRDKIGITFDCPCGCDSPIFIHVQNPPDGGPPAQKHPSWEITGTDFATITIRPSIKRISHCKWHGFITDGVAHGQCEA